MTKNPIHREDPPASSSSDDEEAESSSGEEESSSEEDVAKPPPSTSKPSITKPTASAPTKKQVSSSEEEEDSSSEEEVDPKVKPPSSTTSKPKPTVSVPTPSTKPKPAPPTPKPTTTKPAGTKRPNEGSSREDGKRVKKDTAAEDTSKKPFERKWSLDDELALLEGVITFKKDKGINPNEDTNGFFDSVKDSISSEEFSKDQCMEKIRSLKKKYIRKDKKGKDVVFTSSHDLKCLELAKSIWGVNGLCIGSAKSKVVSRKSERKNQKLETVKQDLFARRNVEEVGGGGDNKGLVSGGGEVEVSDWFDESFLVERVAGYGLDERAVKLGWRLAPVEGKKRIKEEMKELRAKEFECVVLKSDIVKEVGLMIAEVLKHHDI